MRTFLINELIKKIKLRRHQALPDGLISNRLISSDDNTHDSWSEELLLILQEYIEEWAFFGLLFLLYFADFVAGVL